MVRRLHILGRSTHPWIPPNKKSGKPTTFMSSSTHCCQDFLYLPIHLVAVTSTFLQGRYPTIHTPTFQVPKPPQSAMPHHIRHTLYTQKTVQIHSVFPMLQRHPAHPSHHHPFRSLQTMCNVFRPLQTLEICFLHRPGFSPISCQYTLDTSLVYLSLHAVWCTLSCQDRK